MPHPARVLRHVALIAGLLATTGSVGCKGSQVPVPTADSNRSSTQQRDGDSSDRPGAAVKRLGSVVYPVPNAVVGKAWYINAFQHQPSVDQRFYIGFNIAGYGLGLDPDATKMNSARSGGVGYWRTDDITVAVRHFVSAGASIVEPIREVGGGVKVASVADPFGNPIGLLEDASFRSAAAPEVVPRSSDPERSIAQSAGGLTMIKGLGTVIYPVSDLSRAKAWYSNAFQQKPYFDEPFYVGFDIAGYELGLDPDGDGKPGAGGVAYWRVDAIEDVVRHFVSVGGSVASPVREVGGDVKVATVTDPFGNSIGLVRNPHFRLP